MPSGNYCNVPLPEHELVACGAWVFGGIPSLAILEQDQTEITNFSSQVQWNAAIVANNAKLVKQLTAELPEASPVEGTNPIGGGSENVTDALDWTLTVEDYNVSAQNDDFYSALNSRQVNLAWYNSKEGNIQVVLQNVDVQAFPIVPKSAGEKQRYSVTFKWRSNVDEFPTRVAAPAGIFTV